MKYRAYVPGSHKHLDVVKTIVIRVDTAANLSFNLLMNSTKMIQLAHESINI